MQTINVNNATYKDATEATVFGPFFVEDAPEIPNGGDIAGGAPGQPCWVEGTVKDTNGNPVPNARIEVWEADDDGFYDVQYTDGRVSGRAHLYSAENGNYNFWSLTPTRYLTPYDRQVGRMRAATGRSRTRASHLHFMLTAENMRTLVSHTSVEADELMTSDTVFGVKDSLIKTFEEQPTRAPTPDGRELDETWSRVKFDIELAPTDV